MRSFTDGKCGGSFARSVLCIKKWGKLIISDFYRKEPGKISQTPIRCQGSCSHAHTDGHGDHAHHAHEHEHKEQGSAGDPPKIKTCLDGAFDAEELKSTLFEIGFRFCPGRIGARN